MTTEKLIDKLFSQLDEWRHLPSYQLERRADVFFAIYLTDIIKRKYYQDVEYIIPEFPVRIGTIYKHHGFANPNLSFKIDYVAVCNKTKKVFLIELKTDDGSRREKQDNYLSNARAINIPDLVDGILEIYKVTSSKKKYDNLLSLLSNIGWVDNVAIKNTSTNYEIEIVYIQPNADESDKTIITFNEISNILADKQDELTKRFIKSILEWKVNPNNR
jgi:hypothetical protein